jgi:hypothetical protein
VQQEEKVVYSLRRKGSLLSQVEGLKSNANSDKMAAKSATCNRFMYYGAKGTGKQEIGGGN